MSLEQLERVAACQAVTGPAKAVLLALAWFADPEGRRAWPSVPTIARWAGLSRATVQRALRELEAASLIDPIEPSVGKLATVYALTIPPHAEAPPSEAPPHAEAGEGPQPAPMGPHAAAMGPQPEAQSVMNRHEPRRAGARMREERAHRGNGSESRAGENGTASHQAPRLEIGRPAPHVPAPSNLTDNAPRFASPDLERALAELKRKRQP